MPADMDAELQPATLVGDSRGRGPRDATSAKPRSLPIAEWPASDRIGWAEACRPAQRLKRGGAASHLATVSRDDIANRYGLYLDYLDRNGRFDQARNAIGLVTPENVNGFVAELQARVRSVTVWNSVYKLRRAAQLIAPGTDFGWLTEIEKDLALMMIPRSKADRLVLTERLVEVGLTLVREAEMFGKTPLARATGVRNGLLIALLALHPVRIKNFAALAIGDTFLNIEGRWWLHIPSENTKSHRIDERQVPEFITEAVNNYVTIHRAVLCHGDAEQAALWISSTTGRQLTTKNLGTLISRLTHESIGVDVSPHLFRTAGASTAAVYGGNHPHLASALLNHRDPRVTEEHYNRATTFSAGEEYALITRFYREKQSGD
ncbi:MAG: tyrosine-type recombinase/integrase [Bradyrhizobium sp.]|uniref:tyrosine-type recombinase/integrase n=1 Tax=Bradyrhizobium sp. TaxID=376 RepID=UPI002725B2FF|nr:tyrosine-type recombinase/integrase [Bradyrhizobium sp.]MDO8400764.1 tyrosine-type recombinase/integrase [Bradyrhizobium sp.]